MIPKRDAEDCSALTPLKIVQMIEQDMVINALKNKLDHMFMNSNIMEN